MLRQLGAEPVVCDVYDREAFVAAVKAYRPDMVMHQLTDLPDRVDQLQSFRERNNRMRTEGTSNLIAAARESGATHLLAQSIAWRPAGGGKAVEQHERMILDAGGVVVEYGVLYGPGTFSADQVPPPPRIHVDEAARRTVQLLESPSGVYRVTDDN